MQTKAISTSMGFKAFNHVVFFIISIIIADSIFYSSVYAEPYPPHDYIPKPALTSPACNEFTFDATQSQIPQSKNISYFWDFGDGATSIQPIVRHIYQQPGDYTVKLSVTDNSGFECSTAATTQIVRANIPPKASFISQNLVCVNKTLTFDATADSNTKKEDLKYTWNFGDGTTSVGERYIVKSYRKGGDYKVQLTVDDQTGSTCSSQTMEKVIHINEPPVAEAGDGVAQKCITGAEDVIINFDASATTDANDDQLAYLWDFGDGSTAKGIEASHRYNQTGNYDVKLIVSDNTNLHCGTGVDFVTVKIGHAPKADAGKDITVCAEEDIDFDGTRSYIQKAGTAVAQWFFGDGTSQNGLKVKHRYYQPGTYQATLTLENKLNTMCPVSRDTRTITVNSTPIVAIRSLTSECIGKEVFFDASSAADADGDELDYYWNFGDGSTSRSGPKVTHQYTQGGKYRVSIIVDDRKGTSCSSTTAETNIFINTPPSADAGLNQSCCVNKKTHFSASASSDPDDDQLVYIWDLGDGTVKRGENVTHAYAQSGSYNVRLTADDQRKSSCSQSTDGFIADVKEIPLPVINVR